MQEAYNKLCKVVANVTMNVDLGLKKIASLEFDKKKLLLKLFDVDGNGFDDKLSATKIAYLAKNFRNFLRNNNRKARGKNNVEPRNFRRNEPTKVNNTDKPKGKVGQTSNNSMGQQCFGC